MKSENVESQVAAKFNQLGVLERVGQMGRGVSDKSVGLNELKAVLREAEEHNLSHEDYPELKQLHSKMVEAEAWFGAIKEVYSTKSMVEELPAP